jgi:nitric oxide synthase oxygenase domain/subunit
MKPGTENIQGQGFHTDPSRINKEGRPKGTRNLSTILREMLEEEIEVNIDGVKSRKQFQEVIIRKLLKKANEGDIRAIIEVFDRTEGKSKQEIRVDGIQATPTIQIFNQSPPMASSEDKIDV